MVSPVYTGNSDSNDFTENSGLGEKAYCPDAQRAGAGGFPQVGIRAGRRVWLTRVISVEVTVMPADAKMGFFVGLVVVVGVAMMYFRQEPTAAVAAHGSPAVAVMPSPADLPAVKAGERR